MWIRRLCIFMLLAIVMAASLQFPTASELLAAGSSKKSDKSRKDSGSAITATALTVTAGDPETIDESSIDGNGNFIITTRSRTIVAVSELLTGAAILGAASEP